MIFCPNNLITSANATVNGEVTGLPKANMLSNRLNERTQFTDYIDVDLGAATLIDIIAYTGNSTVIIQANSSESWGSPPFELLLTSPLNFISQTYRYWRLNATVALTGIDYTVSGTDVSLTSPDDQYDTAANFQPAEAGSPGGSCNLFIGDWRWNRIGAPGGSVVFSGASTGSTYGQIYFQGGGAAWDTFASSGSDGVQTFTVPRLANADGLGGLFKFYYLNSAFVIAFNGNTSNIVIAQNWSVYKGSISPSNLVVRWDGVAGPAGGGSAVDTTNTITGTGVGKVNHFFIGNKLIFPDPRYGSIPKYDDTDIESFSASIQRYTTNGVQAIEQGFDFRNKSRAEYERMLTFATASYRNKSGYFAQTEDNLTLFPPYFARVKMAFGNRKFIEYYNFKSSVQEMK